MNVVQLLRRPRGNSFSIERLFEDVRAHMTTDIQVDTWTCRFLSKGVLPRLFDALTAKTIRADVYHVTGDVHYLTYFLPRKRTILTIHDLVSLQRLRGLKRLALWFFWYYLPVKCATSVTVISDATRKALIEAVPAARDKTIVIHNCVSSEFRPQSKPFNSIKPRILQIGTGPNKNLERVAQAIAALSCTLVVIGELSAAQVTALSNNNIDAENHVHLSREALLEQYLMADILMFASTYEGFGLPIVEAQAVGRPVITSNVTSMPEIAGNCACMVDPFDAQSIKAAVMRLVNDTAYREDLVERGYANVERFSAVAVADRYLDLYKKIACAIA